MTFGSLFSGVGGIDLGLERAGMRCAWQCEIDPQARSVLRRHWPDVPLHEDVRNVGRSNLAPVDVVCGGFPCQDLSVAGRRAGLAGERSGLWHEFHRVLSEIRPRWVAIENVPGLLSSNGGRDLSVLLGGLADLGYWWTYRVLDSRYFGVPQRRRRVFIVGHLGAPCPPEILLEPQSLPGDSAARGEAREGAAGGTEIGTRSEGWPAGVAPGLANTLPTKYRGDPHEQTDTLVAHTLRAEGFDASEDGTGRGTPIVPAYAIQERAVSENLKNGPGGKGFQAEQAYTLEARHHVQAVAFDWMAGESGKDDSFRGKGRKWIERAGDYTGALGASKRDGVVEPWHAAPRRLTPRECERLQHWPIGWTRYGVTEDGRSVELADGPRYRMAGNGVTSSVAEWIGRRIIEASTVAVPDPSSEDR